MGLTAAGGATCPDVQASRAHIRDDTTMVKSAMVVCGVGNVGFAATFLKTIGMDRPGSGVPIWYLEDRTSGCDFRAFERIFSGRFDAVLRHNGRGGCNALWSQAVKLAADQHLGCVIVTNDDIMASRPGLAAQMLQVLERNPQVASVGVGSDGAWDQEHHARERWFTDPSLLVELDAHCEDFQEVPVKYVHHVSGICWATRPKLWLESGGIPGPCFWGWGEIVPCIELRKMGYQSVSVQYPVTLTHWTGGAALDIHSDPARHESFVRRSLEMGNEGEYVQKRYGCGHAHLMAQDFDSNLPRMNLPPLRFAPDFIA